MKKNTDSLIKKIDKAITIEEEAVRIYMRHIETVLTWSGFDAKLLNDIKKQLTIILVDSVKHKKYLMRIKKVVTKK